MSLNEDLVRGARGLTPNLAETVESLLAAFLEAQETRVAEFARQVDAHIAASNAFVAQHGSLADEFGSL